MTDQEQNRRVITLAPESVTVETADALCIFTLTRPNVYDAEIALKPGHVGNGRKLGLRRTLEALTQMFEEIGASTMEAQTPLDVPAATKIALDAGYSEIDRDETSIYWRLTADEWFRRRPRCPKADQVNKKGTVYRFEDERGAQWFEWRAPYTYESFSEIERGHGVDKVNEGMGWMFENTDCLIIMAKLSKDNIAVHKVAERTGCTVTPGSDPDWDDSKITIGQWCRLHPESTANKKRPAP